MDDETRISNRPHKRRAVTTDDDNRRILQPFCEEVGTVNATGSDVTEAEAVSVEAVGVGSTGAYSSAPVSYGFAESKLTVAAESLFSLESELAAAALADMRSQILTGGPPLQIIACQRPILGPVVDCLLLRTDPGVVNAACRVICSISAKNSDARTRVLADTRILTKITALIILAADVEDAGTTRIAAGAMWALCSLVMNNPVLQCALTAARPDVLRSIKKLLHSDVEEVQSASAWALSNLAKGVPSVQNLFVEDEELGVMESLLTIIRNPVATYASKGLAAWAVQAIVFENPSNQNRVFAMRAVDVLSTLLASEVAPCTQASAVWAISTISAGIVEIQDSIRTRFEGAVLSRIVELLGSGAVQVQHQAADAVYNICARNAVNQTAVEVLGGIGKLAAMVRSSLSTRQHLHGVKFKLAEKALTALLYVVLKHPRNQKLLAETQFAVQDFVTLLGSPLARVQGLAAGIIRVISANRPQLQLSCIALGAFGHLLAICKSPDTFAQEQAVVALNSLLTGQSNSIPFLRALGGETVLTSILTSYGAAKTSPSPSNLAVTCAMISLCIIGEFDRTVFLQLYANEELTAFLIRTSRTSTASAYFQPESPLLRHADRLLRNILPPEQYMCLGQTACRLLLGTLQAIPLLREATAIGSDSAPAAHETTAATGGAAAILCCICMSEDRSSDLPIVNLPCFHAFHILCIQAWLERGRDSCPSCKTPVLINIQKLLLL